MTDLNNILQTFYTTDRLSLYMRDQGGPFGFDIHFALEVDYLLNKYKCDAFIETGTHLADTTYYLSKLYPDLTIISSEIDELYYSISKDRLKNRQNVQLFFESSEKVIQKTNNKYKVPFYYLDAHWEDYWPLVDEISNIERGIVCVGDFYIDRTNYNFPIKYGFDTYNNIRCDKDLIAKCTGYNTAIYANNIYNLDKYPLPCLQMERRSGRCYFVKNIDTDYFKNSDYFVKVVP